MLGNYKGSRYSGQMVGLELIGIMNFDDLDINDGIDYSKTIIDQFLDCLHDVDFIQDVKVEDERIIITVERYSTIAMFYYIAKYAGVWVHSMPDKHIVVREEGTDNSALCFKLDIHMNVTFGDIEETANATAYLAWMFENNKFRTMTGKIHMPFFNFFYETTDVMRSLFTRLKAWTVQLGCEEPVWFHLNHMCNGARYTLDDWLDNKPPEYVY